MVLLLRCRIMLGVLCRLLLWRGPTLWVVVAVVVVLVVVFVFVVMTVFAEVARM